MSILVCKDYTIQINDYSLNKGQYKILLTKTYCTLKRTKLIKGNLFPSMAYQMYYFYLTNLSLFKVLLTGQQGYL